MPDPNKHEALEKNGFEIAKTCATCTRWSETGGGWGYCAALRYTHAKHGESVVGTPAIGTCSRHIVSLPRVTARAGEDYAARYAED